MITFLFWNLNQKPIGRSVANLAFRHSVDVIMLAESSDEPADLLACLNQRGAADYDYSPGLGCQAIRVFARFPGEFARPLEESDRLTIRRVQLPGLDDFLLVVVHMPSKLHWSDQSQACECYPLSTTIRQAEERVGHSRTVLVGDLNMNPFEDGVVSAAGLHGVMSRRVAEKRHRVVQSQDYPFFYNPMWGLFGDRSVAPPGTYYYAGSEHRVFFWNMFDQVLIRPDLLSAFDSRDLRILDSDGQTSLLSPAGIPRSGDVSDHLPILFSLGL